MARSPDPDGTRSCAGPRSLLVRRELIKELISDAMKLVQVGWVLGASGDPVEYLVNMTDSQERELEAVLKDAYAHGRVSEYWLADALVLPFKTFMEKALKAH